MLQENQLHFTFVSTEKPCLWALGVSFVVQLVAVLLLIQLWVVGSTKAPALAGHRYEYTILTPEIATAQSVPNRQILKQVPTAAPALDKYFETKSRVPTRTPVSSSTANEDIPEIRLPSKPPTVQLAQTTTPKLAPVVQTGAFSAGNSATPTIKNVPARDVQTGSFGDPNGIRGVSNGEAKLVAATVGAFDMPGGGGVGNGTGGKSGIRGTVASAGFGSGVATSRPGTAAGGMNPRGAIQQGGFGDARPSEQLRASRTANAPVETRSTPVQIVSKPVPIYTPEARALKLEGEVVLEVVFPASGEARVLRVVRGLGHGLDEAAARAVAQIRFAPAKRDGEAVDSTSVIHVLFQLAY